MLTLAPDYVELAVTERLVSATNAWLLLCRRYTFTEPEMARGHESSGRCVANADAGRPHGLC